MSDTNPALRALAAEHSWTYSEREALGVVLDANQRLPFLSIAAAEAAPLDTYENRWTRQELLDIFDRTADRPAVRDKIRSLVR